MIRLLAVAFLIAVPFLLYRLGLVTHSVAVKYERAEFPADLEVRFSRVIDADTIEVFAGGERLRVQLLGIDGPELFYKETRQVDGRLDAEWVQVDDPAAEAAKERLEGFLQGKSLVLEFDPAESQVDHYGRLLAWVWAEERRYPRTLVNEWLVREGLVELRPGRRTLKYDHLLRAAKPGE
jgi:endonuclease YncB( thermonuclease family)